ncbi:MAG: hypothetical protein AB1894_08335 [Chloroflexota bacterium]
MSGMIGRTRASVELRETPAPNGAIIEALGADTAVELIEESQDWLLIQPVEVSRAIAGYVPRLAVALAPVDLGVFPLIEFPSAPEIPVPAAPRLLKAQTLADWLDAGETTLAWLPENLWQELEPAQQQAAADALRAAVQARQAEWDAWWGEVQANARQAEATLDEWLVILEGGRSMWSVRPEKIYTQASTTGGSEGWLGSSDLLLWSGHIQCNEAEDKYKTWYQVSLYKFRRELRGWYKGALLEEFIFPSQENDPAISKNAETVFDLSQPILRIPQDQEIADARASRSAAQYLDMFRVIGKHRIHYNLCGEFCVATLAGVDMIPLLTRWKEDSARAKRIIENNECTGAGDLKTILNLFNQESEYMQYSASVAPVSPRWLKEQLSQGRRAIVGVGITRRGKVSPDGKIRHWVVLEDVLPVGRGGWVRLYNPFMNQDEVYTYDDFLGSVGQFGAGLWV